MSQQPPPWGPQQYPQQGPAGETPSGVPAPPPQNQGWQQYPGQQPSAPQAYGQPSAQQPYGQPSAQQPYPQPSAAQPSMPQAVAQAPDPTGSVGRPTTWFTRYPRLLMLCGAVLSLIMMIPSWVSTTYSISSSQVTTNAHGLAWVASTTSAEPAVSPGSWNFRVVLTLIVILGLVALGSIGLALDWLLPSWWDLTVLIGAGALAVLMLWGVIQTVQFAGRQDDLDSVQASTAAGVWLFLVTVLVTVGGAVWQFILDRRAAAPAQPVQQWSASPGYPQQAGYPQQPGYQQPPAPQQWNQPGAPQQGWNGNQWGQ